MNYHHIIIGSVLLLMLFSCNGGRKIGGEGLDLTGAWVLRHVKFPSGTEYDCSMDGNGTSCLIYEDKNLLYECRISTTPSGLLIQPTAKSIVTITYKGGGEWLYLEDGDPHPLCVSDSTITIQRIGILYTFSRADDLYSEWGADIRDIIESESLGTDAAGAHHYVLSARERQQASYIQWLLAAVAIVVVIAVTSHIVNRRRRQRLLLQLRQIQEVRENRPQQVRQAVKSVEDSFFASDEYAVLQRRMATGQLMKDEEWQQVEHCLKSIYPGFTTQLQSLYPMSGVEYHVCMLIKLRIPTKDIAAVVAREVNTISTMRKRLYKKVFSREGGARDWDDFILSVGI